MSHDPAPAGLQLAAFAAVFLVMAGAVGTVAMILSLVDGRVPSNSEWLAGPALLGLSFWIFRAYDRARADADSSGR